MVSPLPLAGTVSYVHFLMDAHTGQTLGAAYPAASFSLGPINLTKANSFTINNKVAEKYHEAVGAGR